MNSKHIQNNETTVNNDLGSPGYNVLKFKINNQTKNTRKNDLKMLKNIQWDDLEMSQGEWYKMKKATVTPKSF